MGASESDPNSFRSTPGSRVPSPEGSNPPPGRNAAPSAHGARQVEPEVDDGWLVDRAFQHLPAAIWTLDRDLRFTSLRGNLVQSLGLTEEKAMGASILEVLQDAGADRHLPTAYGKVLEGESQWLEVAWKEHVWQVHLEPMFEGDEITGLLGVALDISEQEETARRLEEERAHLRQLFEQAPGGMVLVDGSDRILDVNHGFERIFGYSRAEALGKPVNELITPAGREAEASSLSQEVLTGARVDAEAVRVRKDGSEVHVAILGTPVDLGDDRAAYAIYRDITRQKELEAQLLHSQRLEAVGQLAGGVAHDFNNALTVILGHVESVRDRVEDPDLQADLQHLEDAAAHAAQLTQGLLTFSRRDVVTPSTFQVNDVVDQTLELLRRSVAQTVELAAETGEELPPLKMDPNQLQQMLVNLILNAVDAMPEGGRVTVRTGAEPDGVLLEVEDTGHGMSEEEAARAFEPYFTTKPQGEGSGLGLSVVYGIVERTGGSVSLDTAPGEGASFRVVLPAVRGPEVEGLTEEEEVAVEAMEAQGGTHGEPDAPQAYILLVDDEGPVLRAARRTLESAGHRVHTASSAREAMDVVGHHAESPDLALVDLSLPGTSGVRLAEDLRARCPETQVVFTSGFSELDWAERLGTARVSGVEFIPKPFDAQTLHRKVREVLIRK